MEALKIRAEAVNVKLFSFLANFQMFNGLVPDYSRKNSFELGENSRESEVVFLKERKMIETRLVYKGMQRFSFLLETCPPGTVPDAFLLGSVLDLVSLD